MGGHSYFNGCFGNEAVIQNDCNIAWKQLIIAIVRDLALQITAKSQQSESYRANKGTNLQVNLGFHSGNGDIRSLRFKCQLRDRHLMVLGI